MIYIIFLILTWESIPIISILISEGISILKSDEQSEKAFSPIYLTDFGIFKVFKDEHSAKAFSPM